eukprot:1552604-Prymnesium_polylepis.2
MTNRFETDSSEGSSYLVDQVPAKDATSSSMASAKTHRPDLLQSAAVALTGHESPCRQRARRQPPLRPAEKPCHSWGGGPV